MTAICAAAMRSSRFARRIVVHQEADGAAVHAVDRLAGLHEVVQGLQHQPVAAERHDDVGGFRLAIAISFAQPLIGLARLRRLAGDEGDMLGTRDLGAHWQIERVSHGTRGARVYDLALDCRGGAGGPRNRRAKAGGLRQYPARHDLALLVAGQDRAGGGGGDAGQDPRLARRGGRCRGQGAAQLRDAGDHGAAGRKRSIRPISGGSWRRRRG